MEAARNPSALTDERVANLAENPFAGQGPVLLDIGGHIGAVVVRLPAHLEGAEIEVRRLDDTDAAEHAHARRHGTGPHHDHDHDHDPPHVAVVARPTGHGVEYSAVFPELASGSYELSLATTGGRLRVAVVGGSVTTASWPQED